MDQGRRHCGLPRLVRDRPRPQARCCRRGRRTRVQFHRRRNSCADHPAQRPGRDRCRAEHARTGQWQARKGRCHEVNGQEEDPATVGHLPGPGRHVAADQDQEPVSEGRQVGGWRMDAHPWPVRTAQRRRFLGHEGAGRLDPRDRGLGPHLRGAAQHRWSRHVLLPHRARPEDPVGRFVVADVASAGGQEVAAGKREREVAELDTERHPCRRDRRHPRPVRIPARQRRDRRFGSVQRHHQRYPGHDVPRDSLGVRPGSV